MANNDYPKDDCAAFGFDPLTGGWVPNANLSAFLNSTEFEELRHGIEKSNRLDFQPLTLLNQLEEIAGDYRAAILLLCKDETASMIWSHDADNFANLLAVKKAGAVTVGIFRYSPEGITFHLPRGLNVGNQEMELRQTLGNAMLRIYEAEKTQALTMLLDRAKQSYANQDPAMLTDFLDRKAELFRQYPELEKMNGAMQI